MGGGAISWQSKKQEVTAVSTQEAEYIAFLEAGREATWLRTLYRDMVFSYKPQSLEGWVSNLLQETEEEGSSEMLPPTQVFSDNQGALVTVKSGALKARFKYVDVKFQDLQENGIVNFEYVNIKKI
jgi:hypothetical protein